MLGLVAAALLAGVGSSPAPLSCSAVPGWTQVDEARVFEPDTLFDYMNGNAEGYLVYGFARMDGITCALGDETLIIDLSDMGSAEHAYGILSAHRDPRVPLESIGMGAQITPARATLAKGRYYLEIVAQGGGDRSTTLRAFATQLSERIEGRDTPPAALEWFPTENLVSDAPRLIPESVLGLRALPSGYSAKYETGEAFVVPFESPEKAQQAMAELRARFDAVRSSDLSDDAFAATDKYLGGLLIARKNAYLAGVARVPPDGDAAALVTSILRRLP